MDGVRALARRLHAHNRVLLLAVVALTGTLFGACSGSDREFGNQTEDSSTQSGDSQQGVDSNQPADTTDDTPSTVD
jgi:hypothetical protein